MDSPRVRSLNLGTSSSSNQQIMHLKFENNDDLMNVLLYLHSNKIVYNQYHGHLFLTYEAYSDVAIAIENMP